MEGHKLIRKTLLFLLLITFYLALQYIISMGGHAVAIRRKLSFSNEASGHFEILHGGLNNEISQKVVSNVSTRYATCHLGERNARLKQKSDQYVYFTETFILDKEPSKSQLAEEAAKRYFDDRIVSYRSKLSILHNVVMFPKERSDSGAIGGEKIINVVNQQVRKEHHTFRKGFLRIQCSNESNKIAPEDLRNKWLRTTKIEKKAIDLGQMERVEIYVLAIERGDYANLHNWARETFNTFITMVKFNIQPCNVTVLFLDSHPLAGLDLAWEQLFGSIKRIGHLSNPIFYKHLVFTFAEGEGAVADYRKSTVGHLEEYRSFVLSRHKLSTEGAKLSCPKVKITLIIRRDAVYHPRNIVGHVMRKIFNEAEIVNGLMQAFPEACVQAVLFETLPFHLQLEIVSQTDILIGMHGAGLAHIWFLPQHAAVLEMFPKDWKADHSYYRLYESWARLRGVRHDSWENFDPALEMPGDNTILPVDVVVNKIRGLIGHICES